MDREVNEVPVAGVELDDYLVAAAFHDGRAARAFRLVLCKADRGRVLAQLVLRLEGLQSRIKTHLPTAHKRLL